MNTLTIYKEDDEDRIKTIILTDDGVEIMEMHRVGFSDVDVLNDLLKRNYFQGMKGSWSIVFEGSSYVIQRLTLEAAITVAHEYIYNRDNTSNFPDLFD